MDLLIGTVNGALAWDGTGTTAILGGMQVSHLIRDGDGWWAVDGDGGLHRNGEVVARAPAGVGLNCIQPADGLVWVGATGARLFRFEGDDLIEDEGFASAPGREAWSTPWGGPPDIRSLTVDASGRLLVNVHVGGILRYEESGPVPTIDPDADVHQVVAHPERPATVAAACAYGLARSSDGASFEILSEGLHAPYCRALTYVGGSIVLSASTGPRTERGRLYRTTIDGSILEPCRDGLPEWFPGNLDTHCLTTRPDAVYAAHGGRVWRSDDEGRSWVETVSGLPSITCLA